MSVKQIEVNFTPDKLVVYGYTIELYDTYICIFDQKGTLKRDGSTKLAEWVVAEGFKEKPFDVKIFKAKQ